MCRTLLRVAQVKLSALILFSGLIIISACGGGGGGGAVPVQPIIVAQVNSFDAANVAPGFAPAGFNSLASVIVLDNATEAIISSATVSINGANLAYNPTDEIYVGYMNISPGDIVALTVTVDGKSYSASGTQFTSYPLITSPTASASWSIGNSHTLSWTGGMPAPSYGGYYEIAVLDASNPTGMLVWPPDDYMWELDLSTTSNILAANSLSIGNRLALVGISQEVFESDYSSYLIDMFILGFSYTPVTVIPSPTPTDVTAVPGNGQVSLHWAPVAGASSYNIYWSTTASGANTTSGTKIAGVTSPYVHTGITNGTPHYYVVTAVTGSGESAESTPVVPAIPGTSLMGGAVQGYPLSLVNSVNPLAGSAMSFGYADCAGSAARFHNPYGITTDGANLYVTDTYNYTIRQIVIANGEVTTLAGRAGILGSSDGIGPAARFNGPQGITTDGTNLYVADMYNHTIRKIVISTGQVTTLAGSAGLSGSANGTGSAARFNGPQGITTDGANLYVDDTWNSTVRQIVISTGEVTTLAGAAGLTGSTDATGAARFVWPTGITTDGTNLYVSDVDPDYGWHTSIRKIAISTGTVTTLPSISFYIVDSLVTDGVGLFVLDFEAVTNIK